MQSHSRDNRPERLDEFAAKLECLLAALSGTPEATPAGLAFDLELRISSELIHTRKLEQACALLTRLSANDTNAAQDRALAEEWLQLAHAWRSGGVDTEAEAALHQAAHYGSVAAKTSLAMNLARAGRLEDAITALRSVVALAPDDGTAYSRLARVYEQIGDIESAVATYLQLVTTAPSMANMLVVGSRLDALAARLPTPSPDRSIRIALLGNATLDSLQSYLKVACFVAGLRPTVYQSTLR